MRYRTEFDSIGKIKVPGDKYWGASTQRSNKYFDIGDFLVRPILIRSIAIIKKAAAIVNSKNKDLDKRVSKFIVKASVIVSSQASFTQPFMFEVTYGIIMATALLIEPL